MFGAKDNEFKDGYGEEHHAVTFDYRDWVDESAFGREEENYCDESCERERNKKVLESVKDAHKERTFELDFGNYDDYYGEYYDDYYYEDYYYEDPYYEEYYTEDGTKAETGEVESDTKEKTEKKEEGLA